MSLNLKIALIVCDVPVVAEVDKKDTYENLFNAQLNTAVGKYVAENPSAKVKFRKVDAFDIVNQVSDAAYPDLDKEEYSGILISGSGADAYADVPWIKYLISWTQRAFKREREVIVGSCFGHQIIALALGGTCEPSTKGWEVGATGINLTDDGKQVFDTNQSSLSIHQMHQDIVGKLPRDCTILARTDICPIQAFIKRKGDGGIHALAVQGHPEFTTPVVDGIIDILAARNVIKDKETINKGKENAKKHHDGAGIIGIAMVKAFANQL